MSWSLLLQNGDLALNGNQLAQVTGSQKLFQDLKCDVLEPMGTDDLNPRFGSLIDGGRKPDGTVVASKIGRIDREFATLEILTDLQRIIADYQARQIVRARTDATVYGKTTLTQGEIIASIGSPQVLNYADTLFCVFNVSTLADTQFQLNIPLGG